MREEGTREGRGMKERESRKCSGNRKDRIQRRGAEERDMEREKTEQREEEREEKREGREERGGEWRAQRRAAEQAD
eukprot:scaffold258973_cov36-Tisochrysis_lutea.AAC.3